MMASIELTSAAFATTGSRAGAVGAVVGCSFVIGDGCGEGFSVWAMAIALTPKMTMAVAIVLKQDREYAATIFMWFLR
jgi:hypothetical protein